ncbi:hypothetical protein [Nocardioides sp.]|uniref:hypothetical protein n=1 Tax=Nocardioides sp. TaxID=35761 RepID=UPI0027199155|nr:hypothetical protein [Nocardioides sp.]MDO9455024.1 hypothetical protein [Nocardioides sp.]
MNRFTRLLASGTTAALAAALLLAPSPGEAAPAKRKTTFTAASRATITPGVMAYTAGAQCTANFVFTDAVGGVYVGYAAHCAGKGEATDTNGCGTASLPLGTKVDFVRGGSLVSGGTRLGGGRLAYSSWLTEKKIGITDPTTCAYNDFALVKVDPKDVKKVNPSVPFWGGPSGLDTNGLRLGDQVWSYGNSSLRAGLTVLSPKLGAGLGDAASDRGWSHPLYTVTPGIPGDSGSGFMTAGGKAVGTLSTVALAPLPASNNLGDLAKELAFAQKHSGIKGLQLTRGTVAFNGRL